MFGTKVDINLQFMEKLEQTYIRVIIPQLNNKINIPIKIIREYLDISFLKCRYFITINISRNIIISIMLMRIALV